MKIIKRSRKKQGSTKPLPASKPEGKDGWKILVVDDDPDILAITRLNLQNFSFAGRGLEFLLAGSGAEAREVIDREHDIAVAIIDVVMESDDSGLKLVNYIRKDLDNQLIRIIIRTGQPGHAPERYVIDHYDIDDFKDKSELTAIKLYTTVRLAVKSFRDLEVIEKNHFGLEMILNAAPGMYLHPSGLALGKFFEGILTQVISLCRLAATEDQVNDCSTVNACIATFDGEKVEIRAGLGNFTELGLANEGRALELSNIFLDAVRTGNEVQALPGEALLVPLEILDNPVGFIYLDNIRKTNASDRHLLRLFTIQCASALENNRLQSDLKLANKSTLRMLAVASEFKDADTSNHVKRLARQTEETALEFGVSAEIAESYAEASLMHDVGKIGIPDVILMKPGKLNDDEFKVIQSHPSIGAQILKGAPGFDVAYQVAIYHHERWDGTGYPAGLKGEEIPLAARIVAVVDVFDALVSKRPYKKPWSVEDALAEIKACSGTHFDPSVVEAFLNLQKRRGDGRRDISIERDKKPRRAMDDR
jgi:response regulator RpfG family c-di-GMP phosphodiesterase